MNDWLVSLLITLFGVVSGVVLADLIIVRRETRRAVRAVLEMPETKNFQRGWRSLQRVLNDTSHWYDRNRGTFKEDLNTFAAMLHQMAERQRELERRRARKLKRRKLPLGKE